MLICNRCEITQQVCSHVHVCVAFLRTGVKEVCAVCLHRMGR
jgi:hypothetical protein